MGIVDNFKEVVALVQQVDNIDLYRKILDLQSQAIAQASEIVELKRALQEREEQIRELGRHEKFVGKLVRSGQAYYLASDNGQPTGDPYCSHCWESKNVAIHIHQDPRDRRISVCPTCKNVFDWHRRASG